MFDLRAHRRVSFAFALVFFVGCSDPATTPGDDTGIDSAAIDTGTIDTGTGGHDTGMPPNDGAQLDAACPDADGDGAHDSACGGTDCDDADPRRFPTNPELCDNGHDEDCDPTTYGFRDTDSDGYVDALCCNGTGATATCGDDCNDMRAVAHPTATEACDGFDNDCDASVDEMVLETFYPDVDNDGYGDAAGTPVMACTAPAHYSATATDCNDAPGAGGINPGAMEICDAATVDENCDGMANPTSLCMCNIGDPPRSCALPGVCAGGTESCNAGGAWDMCSIAPGSLPEICNGMDDDCDNSTDEGLLVNCYADTDNDTYPDTAVSPLLRICPDASRTTVGTCPNNTTNRLPDAASEDCAVGDSTRHPFASEICNMLDDNCVGGVDEGVATICYTDADGDRYSPAGAVGASRCNDNARPTYGYCPVGYTSLAPASTPDCDDANAGANPGAAEICDPAMVDENCDGMQNPMSLCMCSVTGVAVSCGSIMGNVGRCAVGMTTCVGGMWSPPCPTMIAETCNTIDDDCNGTVDNGVDSACCTDVDGDTYVASLTPTTRACSCPSGTRVCPPAGTPVDCRDTIPSIHPSATEVCNRVDDNCSLAGAAAGGLDTTEDVDNDGYAPIGASCTGGFSATDCNDNDMSVHATTTYYRDADGDTHGSTSSSTASCTTSPPGGYVTTSDDCNDALATVYTGAPEICDRLWDNCANGTGARSAEDSDGDGYTAIGYAGCSTGFMATDCADGSANRHPSAGYAAVPAYCATGGFGSVVWCAAAACCTASSTTCTGSASCLGAPEWDLNCSLTVEPYRRWTTCTRPVGTPCASVSGFDYVGSPAAAPVCGAPATFHDCCNGGMTSTQPFQCR